MNAGKSLKMALLSRDKTQKWLSEELNVHHQVVSRWCNNETMKQTTLETVAGLLDYKASEFIALGE